MTISHCGMLSLGDALCPSVSNVACVHTHPGNTRKVCKVGNCWKGSVLICGMVNTYYIIVEFAFEVKISTGEKGQFNLRE